MSNLQSSAGNIQAQQIAQQTGMNIDLVTAAMNGNAQAQQQLAQAGVNLNNSAMSSVSGVQPTPMAPYTNPYGTALEGASLGVDIGKSFGSGTQTTSGANPAFSVGGGYGPNYSGAYTGGNNASNGTNPGFYNVGNFPINLSNLTK